MDVFANITAYRMIVSGIFLARMAFNRGSSDWCGSHLGWAPHTNSPVLPPLIVGYPWKASSARNSKWQFTATETFHEQQTFHVPESITLIRLRVGFPGLGYANTRYIETCKDSYGTRNEPQYKSQRLQGLRSSDQLAAVSRIGSHDSL
ncbi:unnamed protein product [Clonostachys rosea]|uniref:Uncharacterized protein n=1 Tax=Bionectria ochroleuca TaxID=29856 RepID=A0ABY6U7H8_BIOOC|nr:unnamed protein product [Clonostachys rosea]